METVSLPFGISVSYSLELAIAYPSNSGQMEWDEFTEFCIEMGATVADEENSVLRRSNVRQPI